MSARGPAAVKVVYHCRSQCSSSLDLKEEPLEPLLPTHDGCWAAAITRTTLIAPEKCGHAHAVQRDMAYIEKALSFSQIFPSSKTRHKRGKSLRKMGEKKIKLILVIFFVAPANDLYRVHRAVSSRLSCVLCLCLIYVMHECRVLVRFVLRDETLKMQTIADNTRRSQHSQFQSTLNTHGRIHRPFV